MMSAASLNMDSVDPPEYEAGFSRAKSKHSVFSFAEPVAQSHTPVHPHSQLKGLILVAVVILVIVLLLGLGYYFFLKPDRPANAKEEPKDVPEALDSEYDFKEAKEIKETMDPSIDPCDDFYRYACGGWISSPTVKSSAKTRLRIVSIIEETQHKYLDVMKTPLKDSDPMFKVLPRKFYAACNNIERRKQRGKMPFFDLVNKVGKFPLLDTTWSEIDFHLETIVARLTKLDLHPLFKVSVDTTGNVAKFMITRPQKPHKWNDDSYFKWTRQILLMLNPNLNDNDLDTEVSTAEALYEKIYDGDFTGTSDGSISSQEKHFIRQMEHTMPSFGWKQYFEDMTVGTSAFYIYQTTPVTIKEPVQFGNMLNSVLSRWEKRTLANYLMMSLLPFASNLLDFPTYGKKLDFETKNLVFTDCMADTMFNFPDQINRMYFDEVHDKNLIPIMHDLVTDIKWAMHAGIESASWMDAKIRQALFQNVDLVSDIEFPEILHNDSYLNSMYKNVPMEEYFEFFVEMSKYRFNETINQVGHVITTEKNYNRFSVNAVDYPFQMLEPKMKSSIMFATAGTLKSMYIAIPLINILELMPGLIEFQRLKKCFDIHFTDFEEDTIITSGLFKHIFSSLALQKSFEAYTNYRKRKGEERPLPGLDLSHDKLFFLTYAQMWCTINPIRSESANASRKSNSMADLVMMDIKNSGAFSKVYSCKSGSPMNPGVKCTLF